jgi:predicted nuclease of predicted toxin-antitoxin system
VRFKADENIPRAVVGLLVEHGHDVETVADEQLVGQTDLVVAQAAANEGRIVITSDRGFGDVRLYPPGTHPGILVVHARELRQSVILMLLATFLVEHDVEEFAGCNVVIEPGSVRVRRPSP